LHTQDLHSERLSNIVSTSSSCSNSSPSTPNRSLLVVAGFSMLCTHGTCTVERQVQGSGFSQISNCKQLHWASKHMDQSGRIFSACNRRRLCN
jgi:hypothetical protein